MDNNNNEQQGQPYQGQPYQGQPYQGQPYQGQPYQGQPYQGQPYQGQPMGGMYYSNLIMQTDRSLVKYILLSIVTCGIYSLIFWAKIGDDMNVIASRRDGKHTMNFWLVALLLNSVTCGIMGIVWYHGISERIGNEARARGIYTDFGASTYWLWNVLGALLCGIGPFVYTYKMIQTMNAISVDYNRRGM